jgi:hypothetical protein
MSNYKKIGYGAGTGGIEGNDRNTPDGRSRFGNQPTGFRDLGLSNIEKDSAYGYGENSSTFQRVTKQERQANKVAMSSRMQQKYGRNEDVDENAASLKGSIFSESGPMSARVQREPKFEELES